MIQGHFLSPNIPGREEKVPFAGSGYNPQKALGKTHKHTHLISPEKATVGQPKRDSR